MPKIKNPRYYLILNKKDKIYGAFHPNSSGLARAKNYKLELEKENLGKDKFRIIKK
mgnify:CR=1 FL=1